MNVVEIFAGTWHLSERIFENFAHGNRFGPQSKEWFCQWIQTLKEIKPLMLTC